MDMSSIGRNIKQKREAKSWKQEDLAVLTDLTAPYIGMIERGEKIPRLETFIRIINALDVSADEIMSGVTNKGYELRVSKYMEKLKHLKKEERDYILCVWDTMLNEIHKL